MLPPKVIADAVKKLHLPEWAGAGIAADSLSFLIGMAAIEPEIIPPGIRIDEEEFQKLYRRRVPKSNSIATLVSHEPLANARATAKLAANIGLREALMEPGAYREVFATLIKPTLSDMKKILTKNNVGAGMPSGSVQDRLRPLWRELEAPELIGDTEEEQRENCRKAVNDEYQRKDKARGRTRKSHVFDTPKSIVARNRRAHTVLDRLLALGRPKLPARFRRALLSNNDGPDEEENALRVIAPGSVATASVKIYSKRHQQDTADYPIAIGSAGDIGRAELMRMFEGAREMKTDEDILICVMGAGQCAYQDLPKAKLILKYNNYWIKTPVGKLQKHAGGKENRPISNWLLRPIPISIANQWRPLRSSRNRSRFAAAYERIEGRLRELSQACTVARLRAALVNHSEAWLGVPWVVAETAYNPVREKYPSARSYIHISPNLMMKCERMIQIFDSSFVMPKGWPWPGTGSALCPQTKLIRRLFRGLSARLKVRPITNLSKAIRRWNALVAIIHLLTLMLCGLRNNPIDGIPRSMIDRVPMDFLYQKEHVVAYSLPEKLKDIFRGALAVWEVLQAHIKRMGGTIANDKSQRWAYGFLLYETETEFRYASPTYALVKEGLAGVKALQSYVLWQQRTWPRHWTNTVLREHGFSELEVRAFHWHHDASLHPFRRHRLEPLLSDSMLNRMTECLCEELGV